MRLIFGAAGTGRRMVGIVVVGALNSAVGHCDMLRDAATATEIAKQPTFSALLGFIT